MYFYYDKDELYFGVDEEVSRLADTAYSEGGDSLYDSIVLLSRDRQRVSAFIEQAVSELVNRAHDICKYSPEVHYQPDGNGQPTENISYIDERLHFYVPDLDTSSETAIDQELTNYIVQYTTTEIVKERMPSVAPLYAERAAKALTKAISMLKTRKAPNETWS